MKNLLLTLISTVLLINEVSAEWRNIRVVFEFDEVTKKVEAGEVKVTDYEVAKKIITNLQTYLQKILMVRQNEHPLRVYINQCGNINISKEWMSEEKGKNTDLLLFISFEDTFELSNNNIIVQGLFCLTDDKSGRPTAGSLKFKKDLSAPNQSSLIKIKNAALSETLKLIAFDNLLYNSFVDSDLKPIKIENVLRKTTINGIDYLAIITPKTVNMARSHFGCDKLQAIPLEKTKDIGDMPSFWAARFMNTDIMTDSEEERRKVSAITMAFWRIVDGTRWTIVLLITLSGEVRQAVRFLLVNASKQSVVK